MSHHANRRPFTFVLGLAALTLCACNAPGAPAAPEGDAVDPPAAAADFAAAMVAHNFGQAADLAARAQAARPDDAAAHLQRAQAEAAMGQSKASATAFLQAVAAGLPAPHTALADPVFDPVRQSQPFRAVRAAIASPAASVAAKSRRPAPESRIRAGNVEIIEGPGGATVRAGDIVLNETN